MKTKPQQPMTPEEFRKEMRQIAIRKIRREWDGRMFHDSEQAHEDGEKLMCRLLTSMGYGKGVKIFDGMFKEYSY